MSHPGDVAAFPVKPVELLELTALVPNFVQIILIVSSRSVEFVLSYFVKSFAIFHASVGSVTDVFFVSHCFASSSSFHCFHPNFFNSSAKARMFVSFESLPSFCILAMIARPSFFPRSFCLFAASFSLARSSAFGAFLISHGNFFWISSFIFSSCAMSRDCCHFSTTFSIPLAESPIPGIGVYFGSAIPISPIFFPIFSNGSIAALTALLTPFAAMNATHTNMRAIISIIMVPKIPPVIFKADLISWVVVVSPVILHLNVYVIPQRAIIVSVFLSSQTDVVIVLFELPNKVILQLFPLHQFFASGHVDPGSISTDMTISQNDKANPTSAGAKARPRNSFMLNVSLFSPNTLSPTTY